MQKDKTSRVLFLAEVIIKDIESGKIPLANASLKAARLARLLNDIKNSDLWSKFSSWFGQWESQIAALKIRLATTQDPDVSISSANPRQYVFAPTGNWMERDRITKNILDIEGELQKYKTVLYNYVLNTYYALRFSSVPEEVFERTRSRVDKKLAKIIPLALKKFVSVYDNLKSNNPEDWSNAVHSCRRILQAVADVLYPPNPNGLAEIKRKGKRIKVGPGNYKNRLMIYVEDHSDSKKFQDIVGSHLRFLGDRLDAIHSAASKGSHTEINTPEEAERYIIYTYLFLGDILSLKET